MLIDGQPAELIPVHDRGLQYGDGLFETIAVIDAVPRFWERHMRRLARGEAALGFPPSDKALLRREADALCGDLSRGVLKLMLTRGSGGRGYRPPENPQPRRILSRHPWPDYPLAWYRDGIALRLCRTRWSRNRSLAGIKHLNRLEQVLARAEWRDPQIAEGLMFDEFGRVVSATQGNLFLFADGILATPDLTHCGITGIMREVVIECARTVGLPLEISDIELPRLQRAEALFVTNSLLGLCPVATLEDRTYDPARIPGALRQALDAALQRGV